MKLNKLKNFIEKINFENIWMIYSIEIGKYV